MSEPVIKQRPTVDLNEFERRMREPSGYGRDDDPLTELARLVGDQHDPFGDVFSHEAMPAQPHHDDFDQAYARRGGEVAGASARPFGDFASIEAGLRGSLASQSGSEGHQGQYQLPVDPHYAEQPAAYGQDGFAHDWADRQVHQSAPRSRRPIYIMAATIAVGVIGIGTAFALKGRISSSPSDIKTIMADASPTKVQPPVAAGDQGNQDPTATGNGSQLSPTQLVNREEQPVDIAQSVQDRALADQMRKGTPADSMTDASTVPVPLSPSQVHTAMADPNGRGGDQLGEPGQGFGLSDMPAPKHVKVVSVRPDGTILPNDQPPAAAMPAPRQAPSKTSDRAGPVAKASTPKVATAKSTSRATTTPKTIDTLASGDDDTAPKHVKEAVKPVKKAKPVRIASADTGEREATDAASSPATAGGGGFAVQLAAPGSEADAKAVSSRLAKKFADSLGSYRLGFHKAESNGRSVYRVRVSSLSKADAVSLCDKVKADGGSCFVAKN